MPFNPWEFGEVFFCCRIEISYIDLRSEIKPDAMLKASVDCDPSFYFFEFLFMDIA
jgi:hypothetical protein